MSKCIITGCALVDQAQSRWAWGDLFEEGPEGEVVVHNASNIADSGEKPVYWSYDPIPNSARCTVYITINEFFEKRGVSVVKASGVQFNDAARARVLGR